MISTMNDENVDTGGCPEFNFTSQPESAPFTVSMEEYIKRHAGDKYEFIATGSLVFNSNITSTGHSDVEDDALRILLLQRASTDSSPDKWEFPGGACDEEDASILHGAARELWEEAGLKATHIGRTIGAPTIFSTRSGKVVSKFCFEVDFEKSTPDGSQVRLDPNEHQSFLWATEEEVRASKVKDIDLQFTSPELVATVLEAFKEQKSRK